MGTNQNDIEDDLEVYTPFLAITTSFFDGLMRIFGLFFLFHEQYPSSSSLTVDLLQIFVLDVQMNEFRGHKKRIRIQNIRINYFLRMNSRMKNE